MSDRVLIALPDGRWIALEPAQLQQALRLGAELIGAPGTLPDAPAAPGERLYTADEAAEMTGTQRSWWLRAARRGTVECVKVGRYPRFPPTAIRPAQPAVAQPTTQRLPIAKRSITGADSMPCKATNRRLTSLGSEIAAGRDSDR